MTLIEQKTYITSGVDLKDYFKRYGKSTLFSDEAFDELYDYYSDIYKEGEVEICPIRICEKWKEYEESEDALDDYSKEQIRDLRFETEVIFLDNHGLLVKSF
jgi:hypothetical protein